GGAEGQVPDVQLRAHESPSAAVSRPRKEPTPRPAKGRRDRRANAAGPPSPAGGNTGRAISGGGSEVNPERRHQDGSERSCVRSTSRAADSPSRRGRVSGPGGGIKRW